MIFDLSTTLALIAAILAGLSPALVALIHSVHDAKIKKYDIFKSKQQDVIENYLEAATRYAEDQTTSIEEPYYKYKNQLYVYTPQKLWHSIDEFDNLLKDEDFDAAAILLRTISKDLSQCTGMFVK